MWWLVYALLAHVLNASVFVIDKSLLASSSRISSPIRYAAWSGAAASSAVLLLYFSYVPVTAEVAAASLLAGVCWVAALWTLYVALKRGEPSAVVPLSGSAVPVFTWLSAVLFLGERLDGQSILAVVTLVAGGTLLSIRWSRRVQRQPRIFVMAVLSGLLFAIYFAVVKYVYIIFPHFLAAFAYSRIGVGVAGLVLLGLVAGRADKRVLLKADRQKTTAKIAGAVVVSKTLGVIALLLLNYAISLGSVTVVNALQGTQYVFLLGLAVLVSRYYPRLWKEEFSQVTLARKLSGIGLVGLGLVMLVI